MASAHARDISAGIASGITAERVALTISEDGDSYGLEANFQITLNATLEEALNKGVPLYFLFEFEIIRPRWYWLNSRMVGITQSYRLSFNALTRQYRLGADGFFQNFDSLARALGFLERMRRSEIVRASDLRHGGRYRAAARLRLDISQLPKPFQLNALGSDDWQVDSGWYRWELRP